MSGPNRSISAGGINRKPAQDGNNRLWRTESHGGADGMPQRSTCSLQNVSVRPAAADSKFPARVDQRQIRVVVQKKERFLALIAAADGHIGRPDSFVRFFR